jgi:hypothetical protein
MSPETMLSLALAVAMMIHASGDLTDVASQGARAQPARTVATAEKVNQMKIRLQVGTTPLTATLLDSKASRDFASLLPLTLTMNDLFRREKYGHLPRPISEEGKRAHEYEVGQIAYWPPGPDVAVYYRQDGEPIPDPGIIILGTIDSSVEVFDVPGATKVTIERVK